MNHEYTWEILFHFICAECKQWWSYAGTIENREDVPLPSMSCPHCGYKTQIKIKEGFKR